MLIASMPFKVGRAVLKQPNPHSWFCRRLSKRWSCCTRRLLKYFAAVVRFWVAAY